MWERDDIFSSSKQIFFWQWPWHLVRFCRVPPPRRRRSFLHIKTELKWNEKERRGFDAIFETTKISNQIINIRFSRPAVVVVSCDSSTLLSLLERILGDYTLSKNIIDNNEINRIKFTSCELEFFFSHAKKLVPACTSTGGWAEMKDHTQKRFHQNFFFLSIISSNHNLEGMEGMSRFT